MPVNRTQKPKAARRRGTGSLIVRKDSAGRESYYGKWRTTDGRQVKRRIGLKRPSGTREGLTETEASRRLMALMGTGTPAAVTAEQRHTIEQLADAHIQRLKDLKDLKRSPELGYRTIVRAHLSPHFGSMTVDKITAKDLEALHAKLLAAGLAAQTRRNIMGLLLAMLKTARKLTWRIDPVPEFDMPRSPRLQPIQKFSPEEVRALARAAASEQDGAIFLTAALTGLRRGELVALRWRDVRFTEAAIRVEASYTSGALSSPKSGRGRTVPMAPEVAEALARLGQREYWTSEDDLVFVGDLGGHVDASALRRRFVAALKRAGLRPLRFHDLRHTFATTMIRKADINLVKTWMGHATIDTTARYLGDTSQEQHAALVASAFASATVPEPQQLERR